MKAALKHRDVVGHAQQGRGNLPLGESRQLWYIATQTQPPPVVEDIHQQEETALSAEPLSGEAQDKHTFSLILPPSLWLCGVDEMEEWKIPLQYTIERGGSPGTMMCPLRVSWILHQNSIEGRHPSDDPCGSLQHHCPKS